MRVLDLVRDTRELGEVIVSPDRSFSDTLSSEDLDEDGEMYEWRSEALSMLDLPFCGTDSASLIVSRPFDVGGRALLEVVLAGDAADVVQVEAPALAVMGEVRPAVDPRLSRFNCLLGVSDAFCPGDDTCLEPSLMWLKSVRPRLVGSK